jgi:hypothetical protein
MNLSISGDEMLSQGTAEYRLSLITAPIVVRPCPINQIQPKAVWSSSPVVKPSNTGLE